MVVNQQLNRSRPNVEDLNEHNDENEEKWTLRVNGPIEECAEQKTMGKQHAIVDKTLVTYCTAHLAARL